MPLNFPFCKYNIIDDNNNDVLCQEKLLNVK